MTPRLLVYGPHLLAASLCTGIAAANALRLSVALVAVAAVGLAVAAVGADGRARLLALGVALALAGWWWGSLRLDVLDRSALDGRAGRAARVVLAVTGPVRRTRYELRVPAEVRRFGRDRIREPVLLELPLGRSPPQGVLIETIAEVQLPRRAEDGFDERAVLRRRGIHVVLRGGRWRVVGRRGGLGGLADRVHARVARSLALGTEGERRAVVTGVVLGEDQGLSEELRDRFRASGLYHLLAVSGQNVALVAGGILLAAWLAGIPRWLGELGALAGIGAYVLAVGWQPSVVRAGVAGALASLAWLAARPRDRWYFLLAGAAVLLAWNPYSVLEPGFQLSFAAVATIFLAVPPLQRRLRGYPLPRALGAVVAVSAACGVATAPIVWLHFGAVPLYSVVANAAAAPAVAPLLAAALVAALLEPLAPDVATALAWSAGWLGAYLALCARVVGGLPHAQVHSLAVLLGLAAVGGFAFVVARMQRPRGRRALALVAIAAVPLAAWWWLRPGTAPPPPPSGLRITFLDVGQGDAVLLQVHEGAVLVDQGPPEARAARQLADLGVRRLAVLVLTHPQRDHVGGAEEILRRLGVGFVLDPRIPAASGDERRALEEARERGVPVVVARAGRAYALGRLRLRVLWPAREPAPGVDPNESAVVLLASYGEVDALLTADAESNVTLPLPPPAAEVLKIAHHGSADAGLPGLLASVRPRIAVISVGARNDYGHPASSTLAALARSPGLAVYRTDRDGRVVLETDGERIVARSER